jgi:hypothetical protein
VIAYSIPSTPHGRPRPPCTRRIEALEHERIEAHLSAGDHAQRPAILFARRLQFGRSDRHRVDVVRLDRRMRTQTLAQVCEISRGGAVRGDALVDLDEMHIGPRHGFSAQCPEHLPRCTARR